MKKFFKKLNWYYLYYKLIIETWYLNLGPKKTLTFDELLEIINKGSNKK